MLANHPPTHHYTYRITWSFDDQEYVGLCAEFPSLSWLSKTSEKALKGIQSLVQEVCIDMTQSGEEIPDALAIKKYSGQFRVRIPPELHRGLSIHAAEQGVSLNRLVSNRLAAAA